MKLTRKEILKDIYRIAELEENWDGYDGSPVYPEIIKKAIDLIKHLPQHLLDTYDDAYPNTYGTISIDFKSDNENGDTLLLEIGKTTYAVVIAGYVDGVKRAMTLDEKEKEFSAVDIEKYLEDMVSGEWSRKYPNQSVRNNIYPMENKEEIKKEDFTGGESFLKWMSGDPLRLLTMVVMIAFGIGLLSVTKDPYNPLWVVILYKIFIGIGFPVIAIWFNVKAYRDKKNGIAR